MRCWSTRRTSAHYLPLNNIRPGQAPFEVIDSPLSEAGVLGFEYGYSLAEPHALVLWEAQFGDFANGAQVIIDQFIASGESKWLRMSGLVMLLPHGYEGQGPEHSSARLERYLQLCAEDNMQVVNCTTPANYFHVLRRQMHRNFRKPLIVMTPKSLLRHKLCVSRLADMGPGTSFHRVLDDTGTLSPTARSSASCCAAARSTTTCSRSATSAASTTSICCASSSSIPSRRRRWPRELARFPQAEVVWCQEEPENMGAWTFVAPEIEAVLESMGGKSRRVCPMSAGRPRPRRRPACCAAMSRSRPLWSTRR